MSSIPGTNNTSGGSGSSSVGSDPLRGLDMDHFLKLFIAELQHQDPLNPMDNAQMMQQISQIREIGATEKLSQSLDQLLETQDKEIEAINVLTAAIGSVMLGQNLSSASALIGKTVTASLEDGTKITGAVEKVTIVDGYPMLTINGEEVNLFDVEAIHPDGYVPPEDPMDPDEDETPMDPDEPGDPDLPEDP